MATRGEFGRKGLPGDTTVGSDAFAAQREAIIAQHRMAAPDLALAEPRLAGERTTSVLANPIEPPTTYHGNGNYDYPSNYAADADARTLSTAYALWLLGGVVSGHRIYLGLLLGATIQTVLLWLGIGMILQSAGHEGVGRALVLIFGVWWIIDLFRIPDMVRQRAVEDGIAFG